MQLSYEAKLIIKELELCGYEAYIVGGAVRDYLLNKKPNDFDIATNATPDEVKNIFRKYHLIEQGLKHGTITIILNSKPIEVTTYRTEEEYFDNRHPSKVTFVKSLYLDLSRRDFTINALAYNKVVIDYFNGKQDLINKLIRAVGNPNERFKEDSLRILRALRFSTQLSFLIEEETKKAILKNKLLLENISIERINSEICKMLLSDITLVLIDYFEVFKVIIPELNIDEIKDNIELLKKADPILEIRLFCLLYNNKNIENIVRNLRFSNKIIKKITFLNEFANLPIIEDKINIKKLLNKINIEDLKMIIKFKELLNQNANSLKIIESVKDECYNLKSLNINGNDLLNIGIFPKDVSKVLNRILNLVIEEKVDNSKDNLIKLALEIKKA